MSSSIFNPKALRTATSEVVLLRLSKIYRGNHLSTGLCDKNTPPEKKTLGSIRFQSTESRAGLQFPHVDSMAKATTKGRLFFTHNFVCRRSNCQGQQLQQRDAQTFLTVGDVVLYAPYTGSSSCTLGRRVQHCMLRSMQNMFRLRYVDANELLRWSISTCLQIVTHTHTSTHIFQTLS